MLGSDGVAECFIALITPVMSSQFLVTKSLETMLDFLKPFHGISLLLYIMLLSQVMAAPFPEFVGYA